MKKIGLMIFAALILFTTTFVYADIRVTTNSHLIPSNGIFAGKIARVIANPATTGYEEFVSVFIDGDQYTPGQIGISFDKNDIALGLSLLGSVNKNISITTNKHNSNNNVIFVTGVSMNP